ncbi:putative mitochondrial hypothetical protein [Leptomonas pyrrhocoris]|uniref:Uncharacterized protein n=1 Tax=Leptomonas pyrrhocoris TaxID=157538 RepID=A0A0N0DXF1_LEPPY|nr:putative mitochondrial hypothetical protein [Leptomonas pyrrhocoris]XP_015661345.1 putative mitochondrial hypothetical protein [Leptomonas pyrrhocoris]KPA82905.1 putative mitochondrial hypothetical protein [Leptomonas pyrrhocoris]KPA82906.1 putative mitochondrial hypothetical protein [Leptomonas pyrrhocoris]|eukprot:XP_015661344.1 putative mitochondrial hypothetical protein [Leptomonas pyrrhocoris]
MFGRRVFASAPLPRHMWAKLHIQNAAQARRMLPSLAPLAALEGRQNVFCSGLAFNSLGRSSAALGGEEGLASQDGKLVSAEVAAACTEWCAQALRSAMMPMQHIARGSSCSACPQTLRKILRCGN